MQIELSERELIILYASLKSFEYYNIECMITSLDDYKKNKNIDSLTNAENHMDWAKKCELLVNKLSEEEKANTYF